MADFPGHDLGPAEGRACYCRCCRNEDTPGQPLHVGCRSVHHRDNDVSAVNRVRGQSNAGVFSDSPSDVDDTDATSLDSVFDYTFRQPDADSTVHQAYAQVFQSLENFKKKNS